MKIFGFIKSKIMFSTFIRSFIKGFLASTASSFMLIKSVRINFFQIVDRGRISNILHYCISKFCLDNFLSNFSDQKVKKSG